MRQGYTFTVGCIGWCSMESKMFVKITSRRKGFLWVPFKWKRIKPILSGINSMLTTTRTFFFRMTLHYIHIQMLFATESEHSTTLTWQGVLCSNLFPTRRAYTHHHPYVFRFVIGFTYTIIYCTCITHVVRFDIQGTRGTYHTYGMGSQQRCCCCCVHRTTRRFSSCYDWDTFGLSLLSSHMHER